MGTQLPLAQKGAETPNFRPVSVVAKWLDGSTCHLVEVGVSPSDIVLDEDPVPSPKGDGAPNFQHRVYCSLDGWMDQGRYRPRPHCARWGSSFPSPKGTQSPNLHPQFAVHICCGQMSGWFKMLLGTEVDLSPGHIVLDGDPSPLPPAKEAQQPPLFGPCLLWPRSPISATADLLSLVLH